MGEHRNIVMVGGGIISLAIALELADRGEAVTLLCRDPAQAATQAAAGMLAPEAESIPPGPLRDLGWQSRALYADWVEKWQTQTGLSADYWPCGILVPLYQVPSAPDRLAHWLDPSRLHSLQPGLSDQVAGAAWFPADAQVDNRQLAKVLWRAAQAMGVEIQAGVTVQRMVHQGDRVTHLETSVGSWQAEHYILATGAWSADLLPVPVFPKKGQLLSVQDPTTATDSPVPPLQRVLFGEDVYLVPRRDGRIVIGATSERVGFTPGNTPAGLNQLLTAAIRLYPRLQHFPIGECWWGFRPTTADEWPILGDSPYANLTLATGHHRNGILLAPITGKLIADRVLSQVDHPLLTPFHWSRLAALP